MVDGIFPAEVVESASAALRSVYPDALDRPTESDVITTEVSDAVAMPGVYLRKSHWN